MFLYCYTYVYVLQEELLDILLDIPVRMMDKKLSLLAGKILLYFAENAKVSLCCAYIAFTYGIFLSICLIDKNYWVWMVRNTLMFKI